MADQGKPKGVVQNVFEKLGEQVKDVAKTAAQEPGKVLEQAVGQGDNKAAEETGIEDLTSGTPKQQQGQQGGDPLQLKKVRDEEERKQKLIAHHRQQLREEEMRHREKSKREVQEEQAAEEQEKQEEIVQLERKKQERAKEAVLQGTSGKQSGPMGPLGMAKKKKQGTKEAGRLKD